MSGHPELSIIICTRNRARLLRQAVESLLTQAFERTRYEILIIDGNSTDETPAMSAELTSAHPHISYHNCPERGLPKARVYGAARARGRVIGYLDDDATACADWLTRAADIACTRNPICFGGPFFAFYETPKPDWFKDAYGSVTHGDTARELDDEEFLCGGNIFFRRDALADSGGFDGCFSNATDVFAYGEETVPQVRIRRMFPGSKFFYDPALFILHLVRPERMHLRRGVREAFELGRGYGKLILAGRPEVRRFPFVWRMGLQGLRFGIRALFGPLFRDRQRHPHWQNYVYEEAAKELRTAGVHYEHYLSAARNQPRRTVSSPSR
ncbi:MAG TPA: glycosyltransferase family 2 protein [Opitutaceae bacterium]